jgi:WD40 repeat protein
MNTEEAWEVVEQILSDTQLNKLQKLVFQQSWADLSYQEIAKTAGYEVGYVKQAGSQLWQKLSEALGEKVSKNNVQSVLKRYTKARNEQSAHASQPGIGRYAQLALPYTDWGEAPDVSIFYERQTELETLQSWILHDRCRLVGLFGVGGIGKTALSVKLAQQLVQENRRAEERPIHPSTYPPIHPSTPLPFEFVIWRSLRNAPPIQDLLADLLQLLYSPVASIGRATPGLPDSMDGQIRYLLDQLRNHRCLVVLDNCETIMQQGDRRGAYLPGYEGYGQLLRSVGESHHQSCLIVTSREKPKGFATLAGDALPVRSLQLSGVTPHAGQAILNVKGTFVGSDETWQDLVAHYGGNPLAIKMVGAAIADFFDGDIAQFLNFLQQGSSIFGDIRDLLEQQINRLSELEQQVMTWLALNREPISLAELHADFVPTASPNYLLEALAALERRSLIETSRSQFTLQPVVMEYVAERFVEQVCEAIGSSDSASLSILKTHALLKTQAKDYIREAQKRLILCPIADRLLNSTSLEQLETQLMQQLVELRGKPAYETGYAAGNLLNLLCELQIDLTGKDLSDLTIWQADLRKVQLHAVNFSHSDLARSVFTDTFSQILCVTFSPDGQQLAASDVNHEIHIWRIADGKKILTCKVEEGWVWSIAFSPDGKILASSANRTIQLWDVETGHCLRSLGGYTGRIFSIAFNPDGNLLASGSEDQLVKVWHLPSRQLLATLTGHTNEVRSVAFSPDGKVLASGSYDSTIWLWDVTSIRHRSSVNTESNDIAAISPHRLLSGHTDWVWSIAFSPNSSQLVSSSSDRTLKLWNLQTGECTKTLTGHTQAIRSVAFHPNGQQLLSGSDDRTLRLWHINTGECLRVLPGHSSWISCVTFNPNGTTFASSSEDQSICLWNSQTHQCLKVLQGYSNGIWTIAFSPDGHSLASGSQDRKVRLWNLTNQKEPHPSSLISPPSSLSAHTSWVWSVAFSPDGQLLASSSEDCTIRLWHPQTQRLIHTLSGHHNAVLSVCFSLDGETLASGSLDGSIKLWQVSTGQCYRTLQGHQGGVWSVTISPDGTRIATSSQDQTIRLWELATGESVRVLTGQASWLRCVAFHPDGQLLASGSADGVLKLWQVNTGECIHTIQAFDSPILSIAYSPNGNILALAGADGTIQLWDNTTHQCVHILQGHHKWVRFITFSPDGQWLASCSQDETIRLWENGACVAVLRVSRPYEGMSIIGIKGLTAAQKASLIQLGAITDN